jgi:hemolysin activation/secretion protein
VTKFKGRNSSRNQCWFLGPLLLTFLSSSAQAAPLGLPDSARPGAVRPEEVGKQIIPPGADTEVLDVPAVIDRPFEIDEGPKVAVQRFRILGGNDMPKFGIRISEIDQILADAVSTKPEGFTIGQMEETKDLVTSYFRERGLILALAVLPVQTVSGGTVDLQVYEGILGRVIAEGNDSYSEKLLASPFKHLIGKPITKDEIEAALLGLTDFPGLSVFGVFQPGQQVGRADIVLKVQEEDRFDFAMRTDNHGLQETGRIRFRTTVDWNNPTGGGDRISLTIQQTYQPKNNTFITMDYERYLGRGFRGGVFLNRNTFDVGGELANQEISGETEQMGAWVDKTWIRSRSRNFSTRAAITRKESHQKLRNRFANRDRLSVLTLEGVYDNVDIRYKGINFATLELSKGFNDLFGAMGNASTALNNVGADVRPSRQGGPPNRNFAEGEFFKMFATASRLQTVKDNLSLLVRTELQLTDDILVPMEQYSIGGPDHVRAFPQAQFLADNALFFSIELIHNMPFITDVPAFGNRTWGELVQLSVFYDHALGHLEDPLVGDPQDHLNFKGAGVQLRFTLPGVIESRLMFAKEVGSQVYNDDASDPNKFVTGNGRSMQVWGDITYRF